MRGVLTLAERLVAAAAGGVLAIAVVSTSWASTPEPAQAVGVAETPPSAAGPTRPPSRGPVPPSPKPAPKKAKIVKPGALPARAAAPAKPQAGCPVPAKHP